MEKKKKSEGLVKVRNTKGKVVISIKDLAGSQTEIPRVSQFSRAFFNDKKRLGYSDSK